jgi:hypothetical protein
VRAFGTEHEDTVLFLILEIPQIPIIPRFLSIPILLPAVEEFLGILLGSTGRGMAVTRRVGGAQSITLQFGGWDSRC